MVSESLSWRKRKKVAQKLMVPIFAKAKIIAMHVRILHQSLQVKAPQIPNIPVKDDCAPSQIAKKVGQIWEINDIKNTSLLKKIEDQGIIVMSFDFKTSRIDSFTLLTEDNFPVIFLNSLISGDKQRFSLAYEIGQLVMFTYNKVDISYDISNDCNAFAAEFLMPEKEIREDFEKGVSFAGLALLKKKWKVSMIALLYRADDLGYLTSNQKRYLMQQFNEANIRRHEPEDLKISKEEPRLMKYLIGELRKKTDLSVTDTAELLCLQIGEFIEIYS